GGDAPVLLEGRLQHAERRDGGVRANRLVAIDDEFVAFLLRDRDRQDFVLEGAALGRARRFLMTLGRVVVLRRAADFVVLGDDFAGVSHVALLEGAPESVV